MRLSVASSFFSLFPWKHYKQEPLLPLPQRLQIKFSHLLIFFKIVLVCLCRMRSLLSVTLLLLLALTLATEASKGAKNHKGEEATLVPNKEPWNTIILTHLAGRLGGSTSLCTAHDPDSKTPSNQHLNCVGRRQ